MNTPELVGGGLAGIILLAAAIKALPVVWGFVKAVGRAPIVLERMYEEFSPNGGGSLRDSVDRIEAQQSQILEWQDSHLADDLKQFASVRAVTEALDAYTHKRNHDLIGKLAAVAGWGANHDRRLEQIVTALRERGIDVPEDDAPPGPG